MKNKKFNELLEEQSSNPFLNFTESFKYAHLSQHLRKMKPAERMKYISSLLKPDLTEITKLYEKAIKGKYFIASIIIFALIVVLTIPVISMLIKFIVLIGSLISLYVNVKEIHELRLIKNLLISESDISALTEEHE